MANDFTSLPIKVDTAMTVTYQNSTGCPNNLSLYPLKIYWYDPAATGDTFVITAGSATTSQVLFEGRCESTSQSQYFDVASCDRWKDFSVSTLGSGVLWLYFKT